jgi:DNA-binding MarR family transcriptional regulator
VQEFPLANRCLGTYVTIGQTTSPEAITVARTNGTQPLWNLFQAVEEFRKLDQELPTQTANTFLYICVHEGCTMKDIADALGVAQSTMSRNVSALSKIHRLRKPGLDLVKATEDPYERRRKIVTLTPKGRQLKERLLALANGK